LIEVSYSADEKEYDITEVEHTIRFEQRSHPEKDHFPKSGKMKRILRDDKISKTILMFISQETGFKFDTSSTSF